MLNTDQNVLQISEHTARKHLRFYDKDKINWITLPENRERLRLSVITSNAHSALKLDEYADYFTLHEGDVLETKAKELGLMCASTYNCLLQKAMREFGWGVYVTDLFENNVKFTVLVNPPPSISYPEGLSHGWMAYRFNFAAGLPSQAKSSSANRTASGAAGGLNAIHQRTTSSDF
jgi:hypothetical protein